MVSDPICRVDNATCALYYELNKVREGRLLLTAFLTLGTQVGLEHTLASRGNTPINTLCFVSLLSRCFPSLTRSAAVPF